MSWTRHEEGVYSAYASPNGQGRLLGREVTCHLSLVTWGVSCHLSPGVSPLRHLLRNECHLSPTTCHLSPITRHLPLVTYHLSPITCHLSPVTYHLSLVTYHLSLVTYHLFVHLSPPGQRKSQWAGQAAHILLFSSRSLLSQCSLPQSGGRC